MSLTYINVYNVQLCIRVGVKYSTCTWYLYLSTYLSVLDVLEYLVYRNVKVLVLVLVLDQKVDFRVNIVIGTIVTKWDVISFG